MANRELSERNRLSGSGLQSTSATFQDRVLSMDATSGGEFDDWPSTVGISSTSDVSPSSTVSQDLRSLDCQKNPNLMNFVENWPTNDQQLVACPSEPPSKRVKKQRSVFGFVFDTLMTTGKDDRSGRTSSVSLSHHHHHADKGAEAATSTASTLAGHEDARAAWSSTSHRGALRETQPRGSIFDVFKFHRRRSAHEPSNGCGNESDISVDALMLLNSSPGSITSESSRKLPIHGNLDAGVEHNRADCSEKTQFDAFISNDKKGNVLNSENISIDKKSGKWPQRMKQKMQKMTIATRTESVRCNSVSKVKKGDENIFDECTTRKQLSLSNPPVDSTDRFGDTTSDANKTSGHLRNTALHDGTTTSSTGTKELKVHREDINLKVPLPNTSNYLSSGVQESHLDNKFRSRTYSDTTALEMIRKGGRNASQPITAGNESSRQTDVDLRTKYDTLQRNDDSTTSQSDYSNSPKPDKKSRKRQSRKELSRRQKLSISGTAKSKDKNIFYQLLHRQKSAGEKTGVSGREDAICPPAIPFMDTSSAGNDVGKDVRMSPDEHRQNRSTHVRWNLEKETEQSRQRSPEGRSPSTIGNEIDKWKRALSMPDLVDSLPKIAGRQLLTSDWKSSQHPPSKLMLLARPSSVATTHDQPDFLAANLFGQSSDKQQAEVEHPATSGGETRKIKFPLKRSTSVDHYVSTFDVCLKVF